MYKKTILITVLFLVACGVQTVKKEIPVSQKTIMIADGFIFRDNTRVHQSPSLKSASLFRLNDGTPVIIKQNKDGWYRIETADDKQGWVRSDLVGPKMLSYAKRAEQFREDVLLKKGVTLYIDQTKPYAVVYFVLKEEAYTSKRKALKRASTLGKKYQKQVYPGGVEVRIMRKDRKTLFAKKTFKALGPVKIKAPFLRVGRLFGMELKARHLKIKVLIPGLLKNKQLLKMAREITGRYGDSIHRVDIYMVKASSDGDAYFESNKKPAQSSVCRLHYFEDANGENYRFNFCK